MLIIVWLARLYLNNYRKFIDPVMILPFFPYTSIKCIGKKAGMKIGE
ncbi:hypothetical protein SAMN05216352_108104 [Alteribacillus bidgolensis]|uniref:Uncharacterized protein n=1 Tax=Alteribacillus bidgolensis TaxID=930129 RepID=A0A1G8L0Y2_9BACI|nr:hypothetical protein SAMN05216352_108104 [Alteribacillus bidgolensis]